MKTEELEALLHGTIEAPAAEVLISLQRKGVIKDSDVQRFQVSATRFRQAIIADYESFEPAVRDELRVSLIKQYRETIGGLLTEMVERVERVEKAERAERVERVERVEQVEQREEVNEQREEGTVSRPPRIIDEARAEAKGPFRRLPRCWNDVLRRLDPR